MGTTLLDKTHNNDNVTKKEQRKQQQQASMSCTFIDSQHEEKQTNDSNVKNTTVNTDIDINSTASAATASAAETTQLPLKKTKKKKKKAGYKSMMADIMSGNGKNGSTKKEIDHQMNGLGGG